MKKIITFLLLLSFTSFLSVGAQENSIQNVEKIKEINNRPLKVVLKEGNSKSTQEYNLNLKEAVLSEWKLTDDIEFISVEDYQIHSKNKNSNNAYLSVHKSYEMNSFGSNAGVTNTSITLNYFIFNNNKTEIIMNSGFDISKKDVKSKYFTKVQYLNLAILRSLSNNDDEFYIYNILGLYYSKDKKAMNNFMDKMATRAKEVLKEKVVLIDRDLMNKKLDDKIKTYYPFEFKIVSEEDIDNAIVSNDSTKVILTKDTITDADTGLPLLFFSVAKATSMKTKIAPFTIGLGNKLNEKRLVNLSSYLK